MPSNEDYLDSLLKQAQQEIAPDSAISRVSELTKQYETEIGANSESDPIGEDLSENIDDLLADLSEIEDISAISDTQDITFSEVAPIDEISALLDSLNEIDMAETIEEPTSELTSELSSEPTLELTPEPTPAPAPASNDGGMMSADDIAAMFAAAEASAPAEEIIVEEAPIEEAPIEEPVPEPAPAPASNDGGMMSADEIAAMFAAAEASTPEEEASIEESPIIEDVPVEEPVPEPTSTPASNDGGMMSADDIAALFAAAEESAPTEEATVDVSPIVEEVPIDETPIEEPTPEPAPVPASNDGGMMSADEIAAMFAAAEAPTPVEETPIEEVPIEEPVPEPTSIPASNDGGMMSADEIAAMFAAAEAPTPIEETPIEEAHVEEAPIEVSMGEAFSADVPTDDTSDETEDEPELSIEDLLAGVKEDSAADDSDNTTETPDDGGSVDLDSLGAMSQEDIEKLISSASDVSDIPNNNGEIEVDINDIESLESLGIFDKDSSIDDLPTGSAELDEISSLLQTADSTDMSSSEDDDLLNLISLENQNIDAASSDDLAALFDETSDGEEKTEGGKSKTKKNFLKGLFGKKKSENKDESSEGDVSLEGLEAPEKKDNIFKRLLAFLTASDEDNEEENNASDEFGFEEVQGENKEILDEIDKEDDSKGKKKGKKDKKGKKKKGKEAPAEGESEEGDAEEGGEASSSGKKKKPKKEKKEKKPKFEEPDNSKPLNKKNVRKIFILAATILLLIILTVKFLPTMADNKNARQAYYKGDYETTYTTFFGQELSEGDQLLFDRSEILLKVEHKYEAFTAYNKIGMRVEALDQLLQAVNCYEAWLYTAESTGCADEFKTSYQKILTALDVAFELTEERAKEINAMPTDLEYSLMVESIANHTEYIDPNEPLPEPFVPDEGEDEPEYEDMLSEEHY